ncbi:MAG: hypothetical protein ACYCX2_01870 [Christensenellales bacterium]
MKQCSVCNKNMESSPKILFIGRDGKKREACFECTKLMDTIANSHNFDDVRSAVNVLHSCARQADDEETARYLREIIEVEIPVTEDQALVQTEGNKVSAGGGREYFKDSGKEESDARDGCSPCNAPDKTAAVLSGAGKAAAVFGIIIAIPYVVTGIAEAAGSGSFLPFLNRFIMGLLVSGVFGFFACILRGAAAVVQNTKDAVRLQKKLAEELAELMKK